MRLREKIINFLLKLLGESKVNDVSTIKEEEENVEETNFSKGVKFSNDKFFGKNSILDEIKKLELEIIPLKVYSIEMYKHFKEKLDDITNKCNILYEDQTKKTEYTLKLTIGVSPEEDLQIHRNLYEVSEAIKSYKRKEFNYENSLRSLSELKGMLDFLHKKLIAEINIKDLGQAYKRLEEIINEVENVEVESNTLKQEEVCFSMCECIYIFLKCNALCDNYFSDFSFEDYYEVEAITFCEIFVEDIQSLIKKTEIFTGTKYYTRYNPYLKNLLLREGARKNILLDKEFIKNFVNIEKKIYQLHFYYQNNANKISLKNEEITETNVNEEKTSLQEISIESKDLPKENVSGENLIEISRIYEYLQSIYELYQEDEYILGKISLFMAFVANLKYNITTYEVYKLVYIFSLRTFFDKHLKNVSENDFMKEVFKKEKNTLVNKIDKSETPEFLLSYTFSKTYLNEKALVNVMDRLRLKYKKEQSDAGVFIYLSDEYFKNCKNILKSLNTKL